MSGVGKGIATASIGQILEAEGYKVNPIKVDPYLNVDAGTMNPTEHGEVFVLRSGLETDQDMGNYERFMNLDLSAGDYITSGMVYKHVIEKERNLGYGGKCVEAIPHITGEITRRILNAAEANGSEVSLVEIGGTVGDYQNIMFIEAARVLRIKNPDDVIFILVSYLPMPSTIGEMKTRPTQNAVRQLNSYGVQPDFIIARSTVPLDQKRKEKIAISCNVRAENVISAPDIKSVYDVPLNFAKDKIGETLISTLKLQPKKKKEGLTKWRQFVNKISNADKEVKIAVIGKYFDSGDFVFSDAYVSVIEAIKFSAYNKGARPKLDWLNAKDFENAILKAAVLKKYHGILVPGGFGESGIEGKLLAIEYARKNKIPYLGLCYGMQLMVVEYARNVLGLKEANTSEINPMSPDKVIDIMPDQKKKMEDKDYGGSMRLGMYEAVLKEATIARKAYGVNKIEERHRHRYEVNPDYIERLEEAGLVFSGTSPDGTLMEIAELSKKVHPFFLGTQFHPEFQARPLAPHPLFDAFIAAALNSQK
ncbi:MAG: CTP synthase [Candidatus Taylorbacteria bacterium RIFCSPLOWO2_01_FULL_45_15b]|uniref:CTP synthase n=1 Tax=Candidatus Taylorbacteria bacterium RIFCSPLOWO2_01_FULL_45_15b TaxID=1802319 RepID=A0A1G2NA77_9BACT|nr:MAG: CTP synthase [Candidatus Taylorbacteria bacterium RIFCSPLOWO2_01_FULL_45_15b]